MEIHHHKRHVNYERKWKNYLVEFLMIFLAVTAGFLAENIRESIMERSRAKEMALTLYDDIKKDTAALKVSIDFSHNKISCIDTAIKILHSDPATWNDTVLYKNLYMVTRVYSFERTEGTYDQIKNSGSLRYFEPELVGLLNTYDVYAKKAKERDEIDNKYISDHSSPMTVELINMEVVLDIINDVPITHELYFKKKDKDSRDKLINVAIYAKRNRDRSLIEYNKLMKTAMDILAELKKDYKIKN